MRGRPLPFVLLLVASVFLAVPAPAVVTPGSEQSADADRLSLRETAALRDALYAVHPTLHEAQGHEAVVREVGIADPGLTDEQVERISYQLRHDAGTRQHAHELLQVRHRWRKRPAETFVFWWNPRQVDGAGLPSRAPTRAEVRELEGLVDRTARRFGIEPPSYMPYRIDKNAAASRVFARDDLRWGIVSPEILDRQAVVQALLLEAGAVPSLREPLALLHGSCEGDARCRSRAVDAAREVALEIGYVPILEALRAGSLGTASDPAFASALLVIDLLEARGGTDLLRRVLHALPAEGDPATLGAALERATGSPARRLDRDVRSELERWALGRRGR